MKKILLPLCVGAMCFSAHAQVNNGGFEAWTKVVLFEHPVTASASVSSNYETFFDNGSLNVNRVIEEENSVLRIENMKGNEIVHPGYFIFGKTPNSDMVFEGGIPITDSNIHGVSMDLNYDLADGTEGFVLIQFRNGDTPVGDGNYGPGTHFFPLNGREDWSNVEFDFEKPIDPSATACVIAIASGDVLNSDVPFVQGSFIEVDNVEFLGSQQTIQGGDFESWLQVEPLYTPESCYVEMSPFEANYQQSYDKYSGNYALRLNSTLRNDHVDVGYVLMGDRSDAGEITPNIAIGDKSMLTFKYFYSAEADRAQAKIVFYKEVGDGFEAVYEDVLDLGINENYELVEYPFASQLAELEITASHLTIEFQSSMDTRDVPAADGSVLLLDEVELATVLGLGSFLTAQSISEVKTYPNPTLGRVVFDFGTRRAGYFRVFNENGAQVAIREFSSAGEVVFNLYSYPAGKYLFRFYHNAGSDMARVIKL